MCQNGFLEEHAIKKVNIMGDKSPKSVNKKATQKQAKNNASNQKKQQVIVSKQAVPAKKK